LMDAAAGMDRATANELALKILTRVDEEKKEMAPLDPSLQKRLDEKLRKYRQKKAETIGPGDREAFEAESLERVDYQIREIEQTINKLQEDWPGEMKRLLNYFHLIIRRQSVNVQKKIATLFSVLKIIPFGLIPALLIGWVINCFPLYLVAERLGVPHSGRAFVPIAQYFLHLKMADKSFWWILHFVLPFVCVVIPFLVPTGNPLGWFFVGIFVIVVNLLVVPIILWIETSRLFQKQPWLGIFMVIPGVNVFVQLFLDLPPEIKHKYPKSKRKARKKSNKKEPRRF